MRMNRMTLSSLMVLGILLGCVTETGAVATGDLLSGVEEVVYVISIGPGSEPGQVNSVLASLISSMEAGCTFDIVANGQACFGSLKDGTSANISEAAAWVSGLSTTAATGTGPAVAWALGNEVYSECMTYLLTTAGAPNCLDSGYGWSSWSEAVSMINEVNSKGAVIHAIAISPDYQDMIQFCDAITGDTDGEFIIIN